MNRNEVWITGLGAETAAGSGVKRLAEALAAGVGFMRPHPGLDGFPAGWIETPPAGRDVRRLDRSAALFLTAAEEAWLDAGLSGDDLDPTRVAVIEGSSLGPMAAVLEARDAADGAGGAPGVRAAGDRTAGASRRPRRSPSLLVQLMTGAGGAAFAARHAVMGPVFHLSAGSISAAAAIGEAFQKVASGSVDVVVAGGAECPLHQDVVDVFDAAGVLAGPAGNGEGPACRPFDPRRNGTLLGEGAGALVLESEAHARRRGASPRGVIAGYGIACEAGSMTAPDASGRGVVASARRALEDVWPDEIGWIKTHGTGTRLNDAAEARGLLALFGDRLREMPLTSLKPMLGHCLGACGAVETVAAVLALGGGLIPRTLGTERVDPELAGCRVVTEVESQRAETILLLFESFGGRCAALAVGQGQGGSP